MALSNLTQGKKINTATIASGETVSDAVHLEDHVLCGFILPAAFTGASVTFRGSVNNSTYTTIYDYTNTAVGATVTQGRAYSLNPIDFLSWPYIKIVSGGSEGAERSITILSTRTLNSR